ncbi:prephenate dehydratase [Thalassospira marina]|uniref:prephenate dehydratase n=1 Tax=Thalassospira marina TaxID=2048283 RepID=A0A2N3KGU2_9PROT|nr:prephenate dehydratase [Thalassospira marina]AUG54362.1 prephenate dehydratase [Thalassospira marina]PKR49740.1 prephenate dehydratase [Thalassospira marina]
MTNQMRIAFQGMHGAYSDQAARRAFPGAVTVPCRTFEGAFGALRDGEVDLAVIPIDNTLAGRVADVHHLLPDSGVHIIGETFLRINHALLGVKGTQISDIREIRSHVHALGQCRKIRKELGVPAIVGSDTAGCAKEVADLGDKGIAAIAPVLAAEIYGLDVLRTEVEDAAHNTTRFIILSREAKTAPNDGSPVVTSFVFRVRNVAAALYKALGGFATNGINMTKLESYMVEGHFTATQFFAEVEAHPDQLGLRHALEELQFFSHEVLILGVYPAHPFRRENVLPAE